MLRTLRLPAELLNKSGRTLRISIGAPLPWDWLPASTPDTDVMVDLRARTFALPATHPNGRVGPVPVAAAEAGTTPPPARKADVVAAEPVERLREEIAGLSPGHLLCENNDLQVYCAPAERIPHMLHEIGRQRELTFRLVGEGTGNAIDLDRFDEDYEHLFVWNRAAGELVGAYRIGAADELVKRRGIEGLYTSTLFHYDPAMLERIGPVLEMGRSFVRAEYQRTFGALHLLWRGVGQYVVRNPRYRHLLGAVSISDEYSTMSQQLMTAFLEANHLSEELSGCVAARNPLAFDAPLGDGPAAGLEDIPTLDALSKRILELESGRRDVPILVKQYLKLGGRLLGTNRDPQFDNAIDSLIVVDLLRTPRRVLERYLGTEGLRTFLEFHARKDEVVTP